MKALVVFLSGLATMATGAFIRTCDDTASLLANSWCGAHAREAAAPPEHCAGCALIFAGMALVVLSPLLVSRTSLLLKRVQS